MRKLVLLIIFCNFINAQTISLYKQFNGRFDFTFIGNTLGTSENNTNSDCLLLTTSSASLNLGSNDIVENAYLYWAGSGNGATNSSVKLNGNIINAQRNFSLIPQTFSLPFFSNFAEITTLIKNTGNGLYTLSDFDLNNVITPNDYCFNRTNFGGWAIVIVYKNNSLPLNQLNVYDGLSGIPSSLTINLNSLNVVDNVGAKIGFLAWEGDKFLEVNETLSINGTPLSNTFNPVNNAFNGTNTITGATNLYNMDLDIYDIQNNIKVGDNNAIIQMTSGQDFVMINTIVTKLNSQLPDAIIENTFIEQECNSRKIKVMYKVTNQQSATEKLIANVPIGFYANNILVGNAKTTSELAIGQSETGFVVLTIPSTIPDNFVLKLVVDYQLNVTEILENNNDFSTNINLWKSPEFNNLENILSCNIGFTKGKFTFFNYYDLVKKQPNDKVNFFETNEDAIKNINPIIKTIDYEANETPKKIFVRVTNDFGCYSITNFDLLTKNCPPAIYNAISTGPDNMNDYFIITGLKNIFLNHNLYVYNRWGQIVWEGNNYTDDFYGLANKGIKTNGNILPEGTYFYILDLKDPDYPKPYSGYLYLTK